MQVIITQQRFMQQWICKNTPMGRIFASLLGLLLYSTTALAEQDISGLLRKMAAADDALNYQGIFILRKSDELMAMRVVHGSDERGVWESIESLNGESRRIVRSNNEVISIYPERKMVTVSQAHSKSSLHPRLPENIDKLSQYYHIKQLDSDRVANIDSIVIDVQPNDNFRYGYRYWIDEKTGVLLKCDLLNEAGSVIEQMMFTSLDYMAALPETAFVKPYDEAYTLLPLDRQRNSAEASEWTVSNLPVGFTLMQSMSREHASKDSLHLVYSDGLASVSVFIEQDESGYHHLEGASSMGALNAYGSKVDDYFVTVMGEVPASTVLQIANNTRQSKPVLHSGND
jgi:sigma-E factor negative regulatory protein RseB